MCSLRKRPKPSETTIDGITMPLVWETRWSRHYYNAEQRHGYLESRFSDGSATISLAQLEPDWPRWSTQEKLDFCLSFAHAKVPDRKDIIRFLIKNGDHDTWATIALWVGLELPAAESFLTLRTWCYSSPVGRGANYFQAIALTKAPEALDVLRACFQRVMDSEGLMDDADFCNWVAYDAICCMKYLFELGEEPATLRSEYDRLNVHPCERTRDEVRTWLAEYFTGP